MRSTEVPDGRWMRIIPVAFLMYTIAFMDRINVGVAIPAMAKDLHFSPTLAGTAFGIFFWGYLILQIPGGHLAERWSAKRIVTVLLVLWGICAVLTGFVRNTGELLTARFALGVCEGGVWPATLVLLAHWFGRDERARANNLWMLCLPVAAIIVSPISGWVLAATNGNWHILFWAEGVPPLVWAVIWWFTISDRPADASWLPAAQREHLERTLRAEAATTDRPHLDTYRRAFANPTTWLMVAIYFFSTIPGYGISSFFPSLLKKEGLAIGWVGVVTALPFAMAVVGLLAVGYLSDRTRRRRAYVVISMLILGAGLALGALVHQASSTLMIAIFILAGFGLYAYLGPFWAMVTQMLPPKTAGGSMGLINALGNLGGFIGPLVVGYLKSRSGDFISGFVFLGLSAIVVAVLTSLLPLREGTAIAAEGAESKRRPAVG
jgi:MFS family permease